MFDKIKKIFGGDNKKNTDEIEVVTSSGSKIRYKPDLIDKLVNDHKQLFAIYNEINEKLNKKDYDEIPKLLNKFKTYLEMHVYIEDIQLYSYITEYYKDHIKQKKFIEDIQKQMDEIAESVVAFVEKWKTIDDEHVDEFRKELEEVGKILVERVQLEEEQLYTLYQQ